MVVGINSMSSGSSSSNSASATGGVSATDASPSGQAVQFERLCLKIHKRLGGPPADELAVAQHGSATRAMLCARDLLVKGLGVEVTGISRTSLLCTGVACMKRIHSDVESEENSGLMKTTIVLIFSLLVMSDSSGDVEEERYEQLTDEMKNKRQKPNRILRDDEHTLETWSGMTLADTAFPPESDTHSSAWSAALISDSSVSRAALREARYCTDAKAMVNMQRLADIFFRCSGSAMMQSVMTKAAPTAPRENIGDMSFLTLDTVTLLNEANDQQEEKLASLVSAAESEAGQAVLRDMILSFKLPASVVGVRRTLLLPREANQTATRLYTETLNASHEAAMRGAEWSWQSDPDPIHRVCAVLAGMAVIIAKTPDLIRKGDAFRGRVSLPFFETLPPDSGVTRLALVPSTAAWVVYTVKSDGTPKVQASKGGFDGFCEMVLLFSKSVRV